MFMSYIIKHKKYDFYIGSSFGKQFQSVYDISRAYHFDTIEAWERATKRIGKSLAEDPITAVDLSHGMMIMIRGRIMDKKLYTMTVVNQYDFRTYADVWAYSIKQAISYIKLLERKKRNYVKISNAHEIILDKQIWLVV